MSPTTRNPVTSSPGTFSPTTASPTWLLKGTVSPTTGSPTQRAHKDKVTTSLYFPGTDTQSYARSDPFNFPKTDWTMEGWIYPLVYDTNRFFLSYATPTSDNCLLLQERLPINRWVHFMVTWDNAKRITTGFVDGVKSDDLVWRPSGPTSGGFCNVHTGVLYIGQEQDCLGGCLAATQAAKMYLDSLRLHKFVIRGEAAMASLLNGDCLGAFKWHTNWAVTSLRQHEAVANHIAYKCNTRFEAKAATCAYHGEEDQRRISCGYPPKLIYTGRHPSTSTGATGGCVNTFVTSGFDDPVRYCAYRCSLSANCYSFWVYNKNYALPGRCCMKSSYTTSGTSSNPPGWYYDMPRGGAIALNKYHSFGPRYFEFELVDNANGAIIGLGNKAFSTLQYPGAIAGQGVGFSVESGSIIEAGRFEPMCAGMDATKKRKGVVYGFAVDFRWRKVWVSVNGVWCSGNPNTNTAGYTWKGNYRTGLAPAFGVDRGRTGEVRLLAGCVPLRYEPPTGFRVWGSSKVPWSIDRRPSGAPFAYNLIANPGFEADDIRLSKPEASRGYEQRVDIKEWQCQGAITLVQPPNMYWPSTDQWSVRTGLSASGYSGYTRRVMAPGVLVWNDRTLYTYDAGKYPAELTGATLIAGPHDGGIGKRFWWQSPVRTKIYLLIEVNRNGGTGWFNSLTTTFGFTLQSELAYWYYQPSNLYVRMHVLTREFTGRLSITQPTTSNIVFSAVLMAAHTNKFIALQGPSEFTQCSQRFVTESNRNYRLRVSLSTRYNQGLQVRDRLSWKGWAGCTSANRCSYGEGDCDSDQECGPGLRCWQRNGNDVMPGIIPGGAGDVSGGDYCVKTAAAISLGNKGTNPGQFGALGMCEGDCDSDDDCVAGYKCFHRAANELVTNCPAGGAGDIMNHDYCYTEANLALAVDDKVLAHLTPPVAPEWQTYEVFFKANDQRSQITLRLNNIRGDTPIWFGQCSTHPVASERGKVYYMNQWTRTKHHLGACTMCGINFCSVYLKQHNAETHDKYKTSSTSFNCAMIGTREQKTCQARSPSNTDGGYPDNYRGWYDVRGCGYCNDYCRWVGAGGSGGDPSVVGVSNGRGGFWSCRRSGTSEAYTSSTFFKFGFPYKKCARQGARSQTHAMHPEQFTSVYVDNVEVHLLDEPGWELQLGPKTGVSLNGKTMCAYHSFSCWVAGKDCGCRHDLFDSPEYIDGYTMKCRTGSLTSEVGTHHVRAVTDGMAF